MTFDYELCMERDGGKAMYDGEVVLVIGEPNRAGGPTKWYPVKEDTGTYSCIPDFELCNLTPPKPELKPMDVVWWDSGGWKLGACAVECGTPVGKELRRITVDPNAMTAGGLAGHGVYILPEILDGTPAWRFQKPAVFTSDGYSSHDEACHAATEWLRERGEIK